MLRKIINNQNKISNGVTLVEVIVSIAIFTILIASIYGLFSAVIDGITFYREKTTISSLANRYLEIARNLSYSKIGTLQGNPNGPLADLPNPITEEIDGQTYQIYYAVSFVDDPADGTIIQGTDPAPNDYKQIKLYIKNVVKNTTNSFLTNISPSSLEGMENAGAILVSVFDAVGQPVAGATINIQNFNITPSINLTRTADENGNWAEVALPASNNSYHISVSKSGYSTDQTYPATEENPSPVKEDATVLDGKVTDISLSIDKKSNLTITTANQQCQPINNAGIRLFGAKLIGLPYVLKFNNTYTSNSSGQITLNDIEWDLYTPEAIGSYMIYGSSPIQEVNVFPDTSQTFNVILGPKTENSLLVLVKDGSNNNPIQGAKVDLNYNGDTRTGYTGGYIWNQNDWSGGAGQENFIDSSRYFIDDGNINNNTQGVLLSKIGNNFVNSGTLTSSSYDTGTEQTSFTVLTWQPSSQHPETSIKFQIATNDDNETWIFKGPDGTSSTYYETPGTTIINTESNRYVRYKAFLATANLEYSPVLTGVDINFVSGCSSPGQFMFSNLQKSKDYSLIASINGYEAQIIENINIDGYGVLPISLSQNQ